MPSTRDAQLVERDFDLDVGLFSIRRELERLLCKRGRAWSEDDQDVYNAVCAHEDELVDELWPGRRRS